MTTADAPALTLGHSTFPRGRIIAYWVATLFIAGNAAVAGTLNLLRIQPLFGLLLHLGYPAYFSAILGSWKVLGAVALLAPRTPRLKEWAYAGLFFDFTSAFISHATVGDGVVALMGPILSVVFLGASWVLRPPSRCLVAA